MDVRTANQSWLGQGEQDAKIIARVNSRADLRAIVSVKERVDRKNYISLAFYMGYQYLYWDLGGRRLQSIPDHIQFEIVNLVQPFVQRAVSSLIEHQPRAYVAPATSDIEDRAAARVADKVLTAVWQELDIPAKIEEVVRWAVICGTAFFKVTFDPVSGEKSRIYIDPSSGEPLPATISASEKARLAAAGSYIEYRPGAIRVDPVSPFEIYVPSYATAPAGVIDRSYCPWWVQTYRRSRAYLRGRYGAVVEEIAPEKVVTRQDAEDWEARILGLAAASIAPRRTPASGPPQVSPLESDDTLILREYHEPESEDYPEGLHALVAGDKILSKGECDYSELIYVSYLPRPGNFWGIGLAESILSQQRRLNRLRSQQVEHVNLCLKPKLLLPRGAEVHKNAYNDVPGEKIEFSPTGGMRPEPMTPMPLPVGFGETEDRTIQGMRETVSIHEVTTARAPQNVRSGVALALLQEQDQGFFAPISRRLERAVERLGKRMLVLSSKHYPEERMVKVVGKGRMIEALWFRGADLKDATDVRVESGSSIPYSRAARQQFVLDLVQYGAIDMADARERARFFEMLELADPRKWLDQTEADERNAEIAIDRAIGGELVMPEEFDDHYIHLQVSRDFQKSDHYKMLPPDAQARIDFYANQQKALWEMEQMQAMQTQALLTGEGGLAPNSGSPRSSATNAQPGTARGSSSGRARGNPSLASPGAGRP